MSTRKMFFQIVDGPSVGQLIDAFKYAYNVENPILAIFCLKEVTADGQQPKTLTTSNAKAKIRIVSLQYEDGSGKSFNLEGYIQFQEGTIIAKGYYHAGKHTGFLTLNE